MKVTRSMTLRPMTSFYYVSSGSYPVNYPSRMVDGDNSTCADGGITATTGYLRINIDSIPKSVLLKSVTIRIYGNRTASSSDCAYAFNLIDAQNVENNTSGKTKIFSSNFSPSLVPYYSSSTSTVSVTQNFTSEQSSAFLNSIYPSLLFYNKGYIHYYEFYIDFVYEADETLIYNGGDMSNAVYVGGSRASSVFIGTKQIL